jgi:hypothetical protein
MQLVSATISFRRMDKFYLDGGWNSFRVKWTFSGF